MSVGPVALYVFVATLPQGSSSATVVEMSNVKTTIEKLQELGKLGYKVNRGNSVTLSHFRSWLVNNRGLHDANTVFASLSSKHSNHT